MAAWRKVGLVGAAHELRNSFPALSGMTHALHDVLVSA
jgi:hypothetical protein